MQLHHRAFELAFDYLRHHREPALDRCIDHILFFPARRLQHEVRNIRLRAGARTFGNQIARMADADTQAPVLLRRQV